jgi:hypothetical protein
MLTDYPDSFRLLLLHNALRPDRAYLNRDEVVADDEETILLASAMQRLQLIGPDDQLAARRQPATEDAEIKKAA